MFAPANAQVWESDQFFGAISPNQVSEDVCRITLDGRVLVNDTEPFCKIRSEPRGTLVLSGKDGCSAYLTREGQAVKAHVQAYRSSCLGDDFLSEEVGTVTRGHGPCWSNSRVEICVSAMPEEEFETYVD